MRVSLLWHWRYSVSYLSEPTPSTLCRQLVWPAIWAQASGRPLAVATFFREHTVGIGAASGHGDADGIDMLGDAIVPGLASRTDHTTLDITTGLISIGDRDDDLTEGSGAEVHGSSGRASGVDDLEVLGLVADDAVEARE